MSYASRCADEHYESATLAADDMEADEAREFIEDLTQRLTEYARHRTDPT